MNRRARIPLGLLGLSAIALVACIQSQDFPAAPAADEAPRTDSLPPPACGTVDDPNNCGACGHSCLGGACARGQCQPVVLAENQTLEHDPLVPDAIAVDATHVTWVTGSRLSRVPIGGGAVHVLGTYPVSPEKMRVVGEHLYLMSGSRDAVVRLPKSGGAIEKVTPQIPDVQTVQTFDVVADAVAWSAMRKDANDVWITHLFFCSLPCTQPEEPWKADGPSPRSIGRSATSLYASYYFSDGSGEGVDALTADYKPALVTNFFNELIVEEMPNEAHAFGAAMGAVARAVLPRTRPEGNQPHVPDKVLASDPDLWVRGLTLVGTDLYWAGSMPGAPSAIFRVDKRGASLPEAILSGWNVTTITASDEAIYFSTADGKIAKLARPVPVKTTTGEQH